MSHLSRQLVLALGLASSLVAPSAVESAGPAGAVAAPPIAFETNRNGSSDLYSTDVTIQKATPLRIGPANDAKPAWGPQGQLGFASDRTGTWQIWTVVNDRLSQLTSSGSNYAPAWSSDGKRIAFESSRRGGSFSIFVANANGSGQRAVTPRSSADSLNPSWAPKGSQLVFDRVAGRKSSLVIVNVGTRRTRQLRTPVPAFHPQWSPDGKWIAYDGLVGKSNYDIFLVPARGGRSKRLTRNPAEDSEPAWSPDSTSIAFTSARDGDYEIYEMTSSGGDQHDITNRHESDEVSAAWRKSGAFFVRRTLAGAAPTAAKWMTFPCGAPASKTVINGVTHITGTNGVNYLCGTSGPDVIVGKGGGDWITGKGGKDVLEGGPGNGTIDNDSFCAKGDGAQDKVYGGVPGADSGTNDRARVDLTLDLYRPHATYGIEVYN